MANSPKHSGKESREKIRGLACKPVPLILRRVTQFKHSHHVLERTLFKLLDSKEGSGIFDFFIRHYPINRHIVMALQQAIYQSMIQRLLERIIVVSIYRFLGSKVFVAGFVLLML